MRNGLIYLLVCMLNISMVNAMSSLDDSKAKSWIPEVSENRIDIQQSKTIIKEIKSTEPFINIQQEKIWDIEDDDTEESSELNFDPELLWLGDLFRFLAMIVEAALWLLPVVILFYLYRYREYWINLIQGKGLARDQPDIPDTLFGLDIRADSLPDDIEKAATDLWQQKQYRNAVSLLYRGSLASLFKQYRFELPPGATEQDCLQQVELSELQSDRIMSNEEVFNTEQRIEHFKHLTQVWITIAYAHRMPNDSVFKQICQGWNQQFAHNRGHQ